MLFFFLQYTMRMIISTVMVTLVAIKTTPSNTMVTMSGLDVHVEEGLAEVEGLAEGSKMAEDCKIEVRGVAWDIIVEVAVKVAEGYGISGGAGEEKCNTE